MLIQNYELKNDFFPICLLFDIQFKKKILIILVDLDDC